MSESHNQEALEWHRRGIDALGDDRLEEALVDFIRAAEIDPSFVDAVLSQGIAYSGLGRIDEATRVIERVLAHSPQHARACLALGFVQLQTEQIAQAQATFQRCLDTEPASPEIYLAIAQAEERLDEPEKAREALERGQRLLPNTPELLSELGRVYLLLEDFKQAETTLKKALDIAQDNLTAHEELAGLYVHLGRLDDARREYEAGIALDPRAAQLHLGLASVLGMQGDEQAGRAEIEKAIASDSDLPMVWLALGDIFTALSEPRRALEMYRRAVMLDHDFLEAWEGVEEAAADAGNMPAQQEALAELARLDAAGVEPNPALEGRLDFLEETAYPEFPEELPELFSAPRAGGKNSVKPVVKNPQAKELIFQLKINLKGSKPPIWRRVLVPGRFTLAKLHRVIQRAMGWSNSHLHSFEIEGQEYADDTQAEDRFFGPPVLDESKAKLFEVAAAGMKFSYTYDFGDDWQHTITVEKILPADAKQKYPAVIAGKRACPPEDIGGIWGYADLLEMRNEPDSSERLADSGWTRGELASINPEEFDLTAANEVVQKIK